jgi:hypothetical protein
MMATMMMDAMVTTTMMRAMVRRMVMMNGAAEDDDGFPDEGEDDEALLVWRDALLVLGLLHHVLDGVRCPGVQRPRGPRLLASITA